MCFEKQKIQISRVIEEYAAPHILVVFYVTCFIVILIFSSRLKIHLAVANYRKLRIRNLRNSENGRRRKFPLLRASSPLGSLRVSAVARIRVLYAKHQGFRLSDAFAVPAKPRFRCARARSSVAYQMAPHQRRLARRHYRASIRDRYHPVTHGLWLRGGRGPFVIYHECGFT